MTTTNLNANPNPEAAPTAEELQTSIDKLKSALEKERTEHKAARLQLTALGDVEATITERTAALTAERDEARAEADKIKAEWSDFRVTAEVRGAIERSGMDLRNAEDAMGFIKPLVEVTESGVKTRRVPLA